MTRNELKEIIEKVIRLLKEEGNEAPKAACFFFDNPCDVTTKYGVNEEA